MALEARRRRLRGVVEVQLLRRRIKGTGTLSRLCSVSISNGRVTTAVFSFESNERDRHSVSSPRG